MRYASILPPILLLLGLLAIYFLILFLFRSYYRLKKRRNLRLGYEGEIAVGQELNQLMLQGKHVYHDFPADKFNIDHIVVGRSGIFAVETKPINYLGGDHEKV